MNKKIMCISLAIMCFLLLCSCNNKKSKATLYDESITSNAISSEAVSLDSDSSDLPESFVSSSEVSAENSSKETQTLLSTDSTIISSIADEWVDTNASQTKEEEINGETLVFKYSISKKSTGVQIHDRDIYVAKNGAVAEYDRITEKLLYYYKYIKGDIGEENSISEENIKIIAENFIKKYCDLSQYTDIQVKHNENIRYIISYSKVISGLKTSEGVTVNVSFDGKVISFIYNPYVFDNVTVPEFNIDVLTAKLDNNIKADFGENYIGYEIIDKRIILDENGIPAMEFFVLRKYKQGGEETSDGYNYVYTL